MNTHSSTSFSGYFQIKAVFFALCVYPIQSWLRLFDPVNSQGFPDDAPLTVAVAVAQIT
jgi:hypothetical protein